VAANHAVRVYRRLWGWNSMPIWNRLITLPIPPGSPRVAACGSMDLGCRWGDAGSGLPMPRRRTFAEGCRTRLLRGSGLPVPHRRTFATALQAFAHSMPASLSASMPALAANAGSVARAAPRGFMCGVFQRKFFVRLHSTAFNGFLFSFLIPWEVLSV
jgi:hypothetical protein